MQLLNLTLHNFGVFRGRHNFNLMPVRRPDGTCRHLTAITGHNGSGKSTLFQALALALHGSLALGDRVSRQAYSDFLLNRLHRHSVAGNSLRSNEGGVTLSFQYVQSGQSLRIQVERRWRRSGSNVLETLIVLCNGRPPDVEPADYQAWLNDLVPPGLAPLCLLDAERLDALANPEQHDGRLSEMVRRLLGLDLVERLEVDLEYYTLRQGGGRKADRLRKEVLRHQAAVDALDAQLAQLRIEAEALSNRQAELEAALAQQERRLIAEGGNYAARRPILQERLTVVEAEIENVAGQLRELSAGLLPFALAPELCQALSQRLTREAELQRQRIASEFWQDQVSSIESALKSDELWQGLDVPPHVRQAVTQRLIHVLREAGASNFVNEQPLIHHLAEPERERLRDWIAQALHTVPQQVQALGDRLRALRAERRRIEIDLQRAPDDEVLVPIHAEIARLEAALAEVRQRQSVLDKQIGALQFQRDERARQLQRAAEQLAAAQAKERQLELAERSKLVLHAYRDALTRQRLAALEEALVNAFNAICRKEHLLAAVSISPDDFSVQLQNADGHALTLADFSAGERQLYALALLWALRQVSRRQLPLAIDTPLARLDEVHRWRLMHTYVPAVSNQVLLFVTDTELDTGLLTQARPYLARVYRLEYDPQSEETFVACDDQPAPEGVVLYRGETPSEVGYDIDGGYGQTWTVDPEHAGAYGELKRALLPATAKRLVLVDPITNEYNWTHIAELERITNDRFIASQLRNGARLYELWCEEWTRRVREAGYDSIATVGVKGPEEYVLNPSKLIPLNGASANGRGGADGT